jgi:hypothetical protein
MRAAREKQVLCLCDCQPQPREWLWPGRVAAGKLTLIDGDPSQGKSLLTLDLVARLSTARPLPDGPGLGQPLSAVLIGTEDGLGDTIRPRLQASGADLTRVHAFVVRPPEGGQRLPVFPDDSDLLRETLVETGARLVVIDPLAGVFRGGLSGFQVRRSLAPLAAIAEEMHAAILMVRHLTKGGKGQRAIYRGTGAIDLIGCARTAFLVGSHPEDDNLRVLACTKINVAEPPPALGFRIEPGQNGESIIAWTGEVDASADDLVLPLGRPHGQAVEQACAIVKDLLRAGPQPVDEILRQAQEAGVSRRTLQRAKAELGIQSEFHQDKQGKGWIWTLPRDEAGADALDWPEQHKREMEQAQKESDAFMARIREKYVGRKAE